MTADVDVANQALQACGARATIAAFNEDSSEAQAVSLAYAPTRDQLLRAAWWNFARKADYLTLLKSAPGTPEYQGPAKTQWDTTLPAPPWRYSYGYPADCVKLRRIVPATVTGTVAPPLMSVSLGTAPAGGWAEARGVRFAVATDTDGGGSAIKVVLTDQSQAIAVWTRRVVEPELWDAEFRDTMVSALAAKLSIPISGDKKLMQVNFEMARTGLMQARVGDGNEGLTIVDTVPDWLAARGGGAAAGAWWGEGWDRFPLCGVLL